MELARNTRSCICGLAMGEEGRILLMLSIRLPSLCPRIVVVGDPEPCARTSGLTVALDGVEPDPVLLVLLELPAPDAFGEGTQKRNLLSKTSYVEGDSSNSDVGRAAKDF
jgi:hypothetical protein